MKRTLSLVLAVLMVLALFGAAAEDTKKVEIRVNMQAGTGVAEAWAAVEAGYEALHPEVDIIIDLKPDEGYADWVKAQFSSENPEADLVAINLAGPAASGKSLNFFEYAYNESPYTGKEWKDQVNFGAQVRDMAKGEWTSISLQSVQVLWFYNVDIFNEVGVEPTASRPYTPTSPRCSRSTPAARTSSAPATPATRRCSRRARPR